MIRVPRRLSTNLALQVAIVVAYVVSGRLGLTLAYYNKLATLLWAPSGIAVAAVWLLGARALPAIAVGAFATNLSVGASPLLAIGITLGNTAEAWIADRMIDRARLRGGLNSVRDVVLFVGLLVSAATLVAAVNASAWLAALTSVPRAKLVPTALIWWLGDAGGVLVVTPLVLSWVRGRAIPSRRSRLPEGVFLAVLAPAVASISYGLALPSAYSGAALALLPFPLVIWAALRFGLRGASAVSAAVTVAAVLGTVAGNGPFHAAGPQAEVASLWSLLAALSTTSLLLAVGLEEREREATARADREQLLEFAVHASRAAAIEYDLAEGRVRLVHGNGAWMTGDAWRARIVETDRPLVLEAMAAGHDAGRWRVDYDAIVDGELRRISETAEIVARDQQGRPVRALGLCADVTERHDAEQERLALQQELEQSKRLTELGMLAGGIAHDFNNLLMVVRANVELARVGYHSEESLEAIDSAAVRAAELTRQLMAYAGRRDIERREIELGTLTDEMMRLLGPGIPARIALRVRVEGSPRLEGDPTQLRQLVMNLALNAVQAIDEQGEVVVRVAIDGDVGVLEVRDDGRGMDSQTLARVFQPFFSTKGNGRGLGMAAVHGIARAHGGVVAIESAPGRGTTVTVRFPRLLSDPRSSQKPAQTSVAVHA